MTVYTLTGATDWPMLVGMLKFAAWAVCVLMGVISVMFGVILYEVRKQQTLKENQCISCNKANLREHDAMWEALEDCCPRAVEKHKPKRRADDDADRH